MAAKKEREYRFMMVGKSGSGKSSTANTIMGENVFSESTGLASGTKTCEVRKSSKPRKGVTIRIVDTPGLFDPTKSTEEICQEIIKASAYLHPGLHAILYVLKPDRFTPEERETFHRLKSLFDHNVVKWIIIIFTRGDELKKKKISKESLLQQADESFKEVLQACCHRVVVFNNVKHDEKYKQRLLELVDKMLVENGETLFTCSVQSTVNNKLERRATFRTQERIERDPALKKIFDKMKQQIREAMEDADDQQKRTAQTRSLKEATETMIQEKRAAEEKEEREAAEKEKQERENRERMEKEQKALEQKKEEEARERERKEEQKRRDQEFADLEKQLAKLRMEQEMGQKLEEEKRKIQEEYEMKLEKEKMKYEREELEKTKQDIVENKETHWVQDVAMGAWKGVKGWFGY